MQIPRHAIGSAWRALAVVLIAAPVAFAQPAAKPLQLAVGPFIVTKDGATDPAVWEGRLGRSARISNAVFKKLPPNTLWTEGQKLVDVNKLEWPEGTPDYFLLRPTISKAKGVWEVTATLASKTDPEFAFVSARTSDEGRLMDLLWAKLDRPLESIGVPTVAGLWKCDLLGERVTLLIVQSGHRLIGRIIDRPNRLAALYPDYLVGTVSREGVVELALYKAGSPAEKKAYTFRANELRVGDDLAWERVTSIAGGDTVIYTVADYLRKVGAFRQTTTYDAAALKANRAKYETLNVAANRKHVEAMERLRKSSPKEGNPFEAAKKDPGVADLFAERDRVIPLLDSQVRVSEGLILSEHYCARLLGSPGRYDEADLDLVSELAWKVENKAIEQNCPGAELAAGSHVLGRWDNVDRAQPLATADNTGRVVSTSVTLNLINPTVLDVELSGWAAANPGFFKGVSLARQETEAARFSFTQGVKMGKYQFVVVDPNAGRNGVQEMFVGYQLAGEAKYGNFLDEIPHQTRIKVTHTSDKGAKRVGVLEKVFGRLP